MPIKILEQMRKIKKSITVFAALLLMSNGLNATISLKSEMEADNCFGVANFVYNQAIAIGYDTVTAVALSAQAMEDCVNKK